MKFIAGNRLTRLWGCLGKWKSLGQAIRRAQIETWNGITSQGSFSSALKDFQLIKSGQLRLYITSFSAKGLWTLITSTKPSQHLGLRIIKYWELETRQVATLSWLSHWSSSVRNWLRKYCAGIRRGVLGQFMEWPSTTVSMSETL